MPDIIFNIPLFTLSSVRVKFKLGFIVFTTSQSNFNLKRKIHDIIRKIQTYVQCDYLGPTRINTQKLEVEWVRLLRRIVKGGFKRRDAPPKDISEEDGRWK